MRHDRDKQRDATSTRHEARVGAFARSEKAAEEMVKKRARMNGNSKLTKSQGRPLNVGDAVGVQVPGDQCGMGMKRLPAVIVSTHGPQQDLATVWCPSGVIKTKYVFCRNMLFTSVTS